MIKLNLHCGDNIRPDYQNYDIRYEMVKNDQIILSIDHYSFDNLENESVEEIYANIGTLESLPRDNIPIVFNRWSNLLINNGNLIIKLIDINILCDNLRYNKIKLIDFENTIIKQFQSIHTAGSIKRLLNSLGYQMKLNSYQNEIYTINCVKSK